MRREETIARVQIDKEGGLGASLLNMDGRYVHNQRILWFTMIFRSLRGKKALKGVYSLEELADIICPVAASYGVDRVYIYGSYARGEADSDSDIDLFIVPGNLRGMALGGFYRDLTNALDKKVDIITDNADPRFIDMISRDMVLVYGS